MNLGKLLTIPPVQKDNNSNHKVNVKTGLDNGAENTSYTLKHSSRKV
jgi:hypothetical protein